MKPKSAAIFISFLIAYGLLVWYIGWNGWMYLTSLLEVEQWGIYAAILTVVAVAYILGRAGQAVTGIGPAARLLKLIGAYWLAVLEYALLLFPIADIAAILLNTLGVSPRQYILVIGTIILLLLAALLLRGTWNAWVPAVQTYRVTVNKQAGSRSKLTIAAASDIHLGTIVGNRHLERLLKELEQMKPDIILLPGDVLDDDIEPYIRKKMSATMSRLGAPLGVYAVLGNHEYIGGHIDRYVKEMNEIGIQVLLDDSVLIDDSFYIIGRKDLSARRMPEGRLRTEELVEHLDASRPLILMDHQPSDLDEYADAGIDISLSGHTHRGQFAPNHWITRRLFELDYGYLHKGRLHAIVSSGFGTWGPPVRIASRCEIVKVEVTFEPSSR